MTPDNSKTELAALRNIVAAEQANRQRLEAVLHEQQELLSGVVEQMPPALVARFEALQQKLLRESSSLHELSDAAPAEHFKDASGSHIPLHEAQATSQLFNSHILAIFERLQVGVCVVSADSEQILYANHLLQSALGEQLAGAAWRSILSEQQAYTPLANLLDANMEHPAMELLFAGERWKLVSFSEIPWQDLPSAILMVATDISALKEAAALREDVNLIMQHDLKSPLAGIISLPTLLAESPRITEHERDMLLAISASGRRMQEMINASLLLFQLEHGEYELSPQPVAIAEVLTQVQMDFQDLFNQKHVALSQHYMDEESAFVVAGDATLLYSCLANLVKNALEASPRGAQVTVTISTDSPLQHGKADRTTIRIHNFGLVPEGVRKDFFKKYATEGKQRGTGLGTYSAALVVRAHGGTIQMETGEHTGTAVTLTLQGSTPAVI